MTVIDDCIVASPRRLLHDEALAILENLAIPLTDREDVGIFDAAGRVCIEDVRATRPIPAHTNAAVDGYAFAFADYDAESGAALPIAGRAAAGQASARLSSEAGALRIFTGAIMPAGLDTVAMQEDCLVLERGGKRLIQIPGGLKKGANRRLAGEDLEAGSTVVQAGARLRAQDLAALAACGRSSISCVRRPRVCIFSTGNEVIAPGGELAEGQVYDANGPMLAGLFRRAGLACTYGGILADDRSAVRNALKRAALSHDLIITTGGASLGEEDHVVAVLRAEQVLQLWQLAIKPGRPMGAGKLGGCLTFALPGNPVAVFVCTLLYVWPVLRRLSGEPWRAPEQLMLPAGFEIAKRKTGRREFFRGRLEKNAGSDVVIKYERDGSGLISSLREASGFIEISEEILSIRKGDPVSFIPFAQFGIF